VLVPVVAVLAVKVPVVHVVHVVPVRHGHVPAALTVCVRVVLVYGVPFGGALVPVIVVDSVKVSVVHVVDMTLVGNRNVPAALAVLVCVALVGQMCGRHVLPQVRVQLTDRTNSNNVTTGHTRFQGTPVAKSPTENRR
jgi:hypothetical protein